MNEESDIIVDAGGHLIIDGGLVTGSCDNLWHGIDVWGNLGQPQTLDYQGWVSVINGGSVEYAETAIETAILSRDGRRYPTGGIVSCFDAVFKDNITDVHLFPFTNRHPVTGQILANFSRFSRTQFKTTNDLYTVSQLEPSSHLFMDHVEGIYIMGCTFGNYSPVIFNINRGLGIESYGAGYFVLKTCVQDGVYPCPEMLPCRFENLEYGIRAFNNNSFYTIKVDSAEFIHNLRGIHLRLVENPTIIRSNFDVTDPDQYWPGESMVGLYLDEATTGFQVEENKFQGEGTFSPTLTYGLYLLNVDTTYNEIYNNSFDKLRRGIQAQGDNRNADLGNGVCLKCNDFSDCQTDILVTHDGDDIHPIVTINTGIAFFQGIDGDGDPALAAGNRFSLNPAGVNYLNDEKCRKIKYTYQGHPTVPPSLVPVYSGLFGLNSDGHAAYSKETSCPSHLGGSITLSREMNILTEETVNITSYQDSLSMLIDGGNTVGLNYDVITSFPEEALVIRQELLEESPYLSDTVMISAIEKEEVLPSAMVRDILIQNPQAPKAIKIVNALNDRQDTIPDYMMEEIMEGLNTYGAKEILEQNLGEHMVNRDNAWNKINLYFKNDTAHIESASDSLMVLYENVNLLSAKYTLAFLYLDENDSENASTVLNSIPDEFNLSVREYSVYNDYQDLFNILWYIKNDTLGLDSVQIQTLYELASCDKSIPGVFAANLLIKEGINIYNEPVRFVDITKSAPSSEKKIVNVDPTNYLTVFPNPAGYYFIIGYKLPVPEKPGIITISDLGGKILKVFSLKDSQNQIVIPSEDFAPGTYLISLKNGNQTLDSQKLTISR